MYTLVFDTTANFCSVALLEESQMLCRREIELDFGQSEVLLPTVNEVLKQNNINFSDISLLGACIGPGSFTGVRCAVASAKALALAQPKLKVSGVTAFEAYIHSLDMFELTNFNAVIIETKRDDFYFQLFNGKKEKLCEAAALTYEEIIDLLKGKTVSLIGNGVERFLDKPSGLVLHTIRMDKTLDIKDLASCTIEKYQNKKLNFPKPLYLRAPYVCVKS